MNNLINAIDHFDDCIGKALRSVRAQCEQDGKFKTTLLDEHQQVTSDLAVSTAELQSARNYLSYAVDRGEYEKSLAMSFAAEMLHNVGARLGKFPADFGLTSAELVPPDMQAAAELLSIASLTELGRTVVSHGGSLGDRALDEEKLLMADTFRQFADEVVRPLAEDIHRNDLIIPEAILDGVRELGCFGLSVPQRYGGLLPDDKEDSLGMIVVTEELSRASLGGAGSLITRPEIMARALRVQKQLGEDGVAPVDPGVSMEERLRRLGYLKNDPSSRSP